MSEPIISVSGLRGIVGESLSPEIAVRFASAFAAEQPPGPIAVSRDGRSSGPMLVDAVRAALRSVGRDVLELGVCATPTVGVLVRQHQAAGAIQVTASHNPPEYNGLKLFHQDGRILTADQGGRVLDRYHGGTIPLVPHDRVGTSRECDDTRTAHLDLVLQTVHVERIRQRGFRVVLDANHGAGSCLGLPLLEALGCRVRVCGGTPDGRFEHPAEPTAEHLADVCPRIPAEGADVGFCQDPDADRLAVIDERGNFPGEEYTLALCLDHVLSQQPGGPATVVTNCATSRMCEDIATRHGASLRRSAVGEAHVVRAMLEHQAVFGGEGNGGPIDPRVGYVRDSFVGMALILDALAAGSQTLSQRIAALPHYAIHKTKAPLDRQRTAEALEILQQEFPAARADRQDGLRLDWPNRWLLIRPSNTEPIVRIIAEAETPDEARQLAEQAAKRIS